jgi:hypothetical protein
MGSDMMREVYVILDLYIRSIGSNLEIRGRLYIFSL